MRRSCIPTPIGCRRSSCITPTPAELGWHFDNSSFAITLLIQKPAAGGRFEYVENLRDADRGEMNYAGVTQVLDGERVAKRLAMEEGIWCCFAGATPCTG